MSEYYEKSYNPEIKTDRYIDFKEYEYLCNNNNPGYRKRGIIDRSDYEVIIEDPTTDFLIHDGIKVPLIVNMKHGLASGYDAERASDMVGASVEESFFLTMPVDNFSEEITDKIYDKISKKKGILFFAETADSDTEEMINSIKSKGIELREIELIDNERTRRGQEQAATSLFKFDVGNKFNSKETSVELASVIQYYDSMIKPNLKDRSNACVLESGANISEDDLDEMWSLYTSMFQYLGERHPISMEDSKEHWLRVIKSEDTVVSMKYIDEKVVCFTDLTDNLDSLYWLDKEYMDSLIAKDKPNKITLFFPGIVSAAQGASYAGEVLGLFIDCTALAGAEARVVFENTNRSERYIPPMIKRIFRDCPRAYIENNEITKLNEVKYRAIKLG